jgi:hypothetical protein
MQYDYVEMYRILHNCAAMTKVQYVRTSAVIAQSGKAVLCCQHSCLD